MILLTALSPIVSFLIAALVICVVIYVAKLIIDMLGLPQPIKTIVLLILGLVALFWLLNRFLGFSF